jgi:hypothetical protein
MTAHDHAKKTADTDSAKKPVSAPPELQGMQSAEQMGGLVGGRARPTDSNHLQRAYGNRATRHILQAQATHGLEGGEIDSGVEQAIQTAQSGGQKLDDGVQAQMEQGFGSDFSGVRIHTGGQADALNRSLNARAFTTGSNIFFGQGQYNPASRAGQELLAHELTHTIQQGASGATQRTIQRTVLDADTILAQMPNILKGNALLPEGGELTLDTTLFSDTTLQGHIKQIIGNYEAQFMKEGTTAVTANAMKILAALNEIARVIARRLHLAQEQPKIMAALLKSQEAYLLGALSKGSESESEEESAPKVDPSAVETMKMVAVLGEEDPLGKYVQGKLPLRKAELAIRKMATSLAQKPIEIYELLRQQFESRMGALTLADVQSGEVKAPEGYMFPLKDLYGEVSVNFFQNLLSLDNGKAQWNEGGLVQKPKGERTTWKEGSGSGKHEFGVHDLDLLRTAVQQDAVDEIPFAISEKTQKEKGWERLNERQMEYLSGLDEDIGSEEETQANGRLVKYFTETLNKPKPEAEKLVQDGVSHLKTQPITLTTKAQDMLDKSGGIIDEYKPFFSVFMHKSSLKTQLPNLGVEAEINLIEDALGRGLDYGQYRMEKDDSQIGDAPLQVQDLPAMACVNFSFNKNPGPNYYGDTHFVLRPEVRQRAVLAYGTGAPERRSPILLLDDVLQRDPAKLLQICTGTYAQQDIEVHVYGNIKLREDVQKFHVGNPNLLVDPDTRGGTGLPSVAGTPTEKLKTLKNLLSKDDLDRLMTIWTNKQKGTDKLKELITQLNVDKETVESNLGILPATETLDVEAVKSYAPPKVDDTPLVPPPSVTAPKKKKKGCYITTACVMAQGLPDDCEELETLRMFRDQYMLGLPYGQDLVEFYYEYSPLIVEAIDQSENPTAVYTHLYHVIQDCVRMIQQTHYQDALMTYITMVMTLHHTYTNEMAVPHAMIDAMLAEG